MSRLNQILKTDSDLKIAFYISMIVVGGIIALVILPTGAAFLYASSHILIYGGSAERSRLYDFILQLPQLLTQSNWDTQLFLSLFGFAAILFCLILLGLKLTKMGKIAYAIPVIIAAPSILTILNVLYSFITCPISKCWQPVTLIFLVPFALIPSLILAGFVFVQIKKKLEKTA